MKLITLFLIITIAFWSTASNASPSYQDKRLFPDKLLSSVSLGWLAGQAHEYFYYPNDLDKKISELDWEIKNTPIIKGSISWNALSWLTFEANGWITLGPRNSAMNDFDWLNPHDTHWTNWSYSPKTPLNYANEFNVNAYIWLLKKNNLKLASAIGYQQTQFNWTAVGGYYDYRRQCINNGGNNCQDHEGYLPLTPGINYNQGLRLPYMGAKIQYKYNNWEFNTLLKYSPWVYMKDKDEHYHRNITFRSETQNSNYYSVSADIGYYMTPQLKFFSEWTWNKYTQGRGGKLGIYRDEGFNIYNEGTSGIENNNYQVMFGIAYQF